MPEFLSNDALKGEMPIEQFCAGWVNVITLLFTITEAVRELGVLFGATVKETLPSPLPTAAVWNVIQAAVEEADQLHPAVVEISNEPVNPSSGTAKLEAESTTSQEPPACATVNAAVPTAMLAVRCNGVKFGSARQLMAAFPAPVVAEVTVSHAVLEVACQVQFAVKLNEPVAPIAIAVAVGGESW